MGWTVIQDQALLRLKEQLKRTVRLQPSDEPR